MSPLLAALMAIAAEPAPPTPAPVDAALIERFIAAVPEERRARLVGRDFRAYEAAPLMALNPAMADEIGTLFARHADCGAPILARMVDNGLRFVAHQLGDERLVRMIRYYESGDARFFDEQGDRAMRDETPGPADEARTEQILAAYPLADFSRAVEASQAREEPLIDDLLRCDDPLEAGLRRLDVRVSASEAE